MHSAQYSELMVCGKKENVPVTLLDLLHHSCLSHDNNDFRRKEYKAFSWLDENGAIAQSFTYHFLKRKKGSMFYTKKEA